MLLPGGRFASTASHGDGGGLTREGGSEGPASFLVPHKEEPEAAFKKAAFQQPQEQKCSRVSPKT